MLGERFPTLSRSVHDYHENWGRNAPIRKSYTFFATNQSAHRTVPCALLWLLFGGLTLKKIIIAICSLGVVLAVLLFAFVKNYKTYEGNRPVDQPGSVWASDDEQIKIHIDEELYGHGTILLENETVEFIFSVGPSVEIELFASEYTEGNMLYFDGLIEKWIGDFSQKDFFEVTVLETTYFTEGQTIGFYKVPYGTGNDFT